MDRRKKIIISTIFQTVENCDKYILFKPLGLTGQPQLSDMGSSTARCMLASMLVLVGALYGSLAGEKSVGV